MYQCMWWYVELCGCICAINSCTDHCNYENYASYLIGQSLCGTYLFIFILCYFINLILIICDSYIAGVLCIR